MAVPPLVPIAVAEMVDLGLWDSPECEQNMYNMLIHLCVCESMFVHVHALYYFYCLKTDSQIQTVHVNRINIQR